MGATTWGYPAKETPPPGSGTGMPGTGPVQGCLSNGPVCQFQDTHVKVAHELGVFLKRFKVSHSEYGQTKTNTGKTISSGQ